MESSEAGPSSRSRKLVPTVLHRRFAAYQASPCTWSPPHRRPPVAHSIFEGWFKPSKGDAEPAEPHKESKPQQLVGGGPTASMDDVWQDHPETEEEKRHRMRCERWRDQFFKSSPMIRFMERHLLMVSCDPLGAPTSSSSDGQSEPRLVIASCPPTMAGGFSPSPPGAPTSDSRILLCANRMMNKKHFEDTLAHEMIHWWDHCRFKVDWSDLRQHACSEIRASSLSGDCRIGREFERRFFGFTKQHQACVRRRAVLSVMVNEKCTGGKEHAERVVDEVWKSCFEDTRPFDEIY